MAETIVVITHADAAVRAVGAAVASAGEADVSGLAAALSDLGATLRPLFGETEDRLHARQARGTVASAMAPPADETLALFYTVEVNGSDAETAAARLAALPEVAGAYVQPEPLPATLMHPQLADGDTQINAMSPADAMPPAATPDFTSRQEFRGPAPAGIDVAAAWGVPGGRGAGIRIVDCEGAWRFTHEDLRVNQSGALGPETGDLVWRNHGTAVAGEIGGDVNGFGVSGICPDANIRGSSIFGLGGAAAAIRAAADSLSAGDIILLEVQYPHPQLGFTAIEWWPAEYAAVRYAVAKGVIVVAAAGNGNNNLDSPVYDNPLAGFPSNWANAFRRGVRDSGSVIVGAGAPPPGTHGRDWGPDRSRLDFSNYGAAIDAQGWGREVTTCGYGDLQGGANEDLWYTDLFSGTSSASPIVVASLGCVQGALKAAGKPLLTHVTARALLRATGSPQQAHQARPVTERIGNRPNLRAMLAHVLDGNTRPPAVPLHSYWNGPASDHFYTTNWADLGGGAHGWGYDRIACYIHTDQVAGSVPLYRYWNADIADHFYTTRWAELGGGAHGWRYEGVAGFVMPLPAPGTVPLHRYWGNTDHFYTTNWAELGGGAHGWRYEGVQCHVFTAATPPDATELVAGEAPDSFRTAKADEGAARGDFAAKAVDSRVAAGGDALRGDFAAKAVDTGVAAGGDAPRTDWAAASATSEATPGIRITIDIGQRS